MKDKGNILRASLLVITLFVATFAGFVDMADAANYDAVVVDPAIVAGGVVEEITLNITNSDVNADIIEILIDGNGNYTNFDCSPDPYNGFLGNWVVDEHANYCVFAATFAGISATEVESFVFDVTTPIGSGNQSFKVQVRDNTTGWQGQPYSYPLLYVDVDGPAFTVDDIETNNWTSSTVFTIDTHDINDSSALVGDCYASFIDNSSETHDLGTIPYVVGTGRCSGDVNITGAAEGLGTMAVTMADEWGNNGTDTVDFGYDTIAPTSSALAMPTYTTSCGAVTINYEFDDNTGNTSVDIVKLNITNVDTGFTKVRDQSTPDGEIITNLCEWGDGTLEIFAYARDYAGNEGAHPIGNDTFTIMDTWKPDFSVAVPAHNSWTNDGIFEVNTTLVNETQSGVTACEVIYQDANPGALHALGNITYDGSICTGQVSIPDTVPNGMGALYVYVYDAAGNRGGGTVNGDDFINLGFDDDAPYVFTDVTPLGPQDPGALSYNATICDDGIGINDSTIAVRINENGIQGWVDQAPVLTPNATCYFVSGAIDASLRKTGESYTIELEVSDNSSNTRMHTWNYYVRDQYTLPTLKYGKNLISTPLIPEDTNITRILDTNASKVDKIYWYDPATETFKVSYPSVPALSDLTTLEAGKGYWFYVNTEYDQTIYGTSEQGDTPALYDFADGSNMVGFKTKVVEPIEDRIVSGDISDVLVTWNTTDWIYPDEGDALIVGQGYWLYGQGAGTYR